MEGQEKQGNPITIVILIAVVLLLVAFLFYRNYGKEVEKAIPAILEEENSNNFDFFQDSKNDPIGTSSYIID